MNLDDWERRNKDEIRKKKRKKEKPKERNEEREKEKRKILQEKRKRDYIFRDYFLLLLTC